MIFTIEKESLLNNLRIVEKASLSKGIQPVLSNILIEAKNNEVIFSATDLDLSIVSSTTAVVETEGSITLPAKKLSDIVSRLPEKPVLFNIDLNSNIASISCGNSKFELVGISANEFPNVVDKSTLTDKESFQIEVAPFVKGIKHTVYAAANYENRNIISGVYCSIDGTKLEMAATDGNRLTRIIESINNEDDKKQAFVIPSRTLQEILRIVSLVNDTVLEIYAEASRIIIKTTNVILSSRLLEGEYPPYRQLIPSSCAKEATVKREELINALERVSVMVNERTNIIKFTFNKDNLMLKADMEKGASEDVISIDFSDSEELVIAFNYRYVLDSLKIMESKDVKIGLGGSLSATIFKPDSEDDYLCLIMPIQIR